MSHQLYDVNRFVKFIWKNIPGLGAVVILDKNEKVLQSETSIKFEKEFSYSYLVGIAKKLSKRFAVDFQDDMGGLGLTINVFKKYTILVTAIDSEQLLVLVAPNETDIDSSVNFVSNLERLYKP